MDPLTAWIVGVASSTLSNILADLFTGKSDRARREEIAQQVALALKQQQFDDHGVELEHYRRENHSLTVLLRRVMDEIEILSARDPDLHVTRDYIQLKKTNIVSSPFRRDKREQAALLTKLALLQEIVDERKRELSMSTTQAEGALQPIDGSTTPVSDSAGTQRNEQVMQDSPSDEPEVVWVQAQENPRGGRWADAIREMEERIYKRRSGGDLADE
jgi:hypothetical protein